MQPMSEGINLDPQVLMSVQNERIAASAIREAQLTAAVQQLTMEKMALQEQNNVLEDKVTELTADVVVEDEDASTDE